MSESTEFREKKSLKGEMMKLYTGPWDNKVFVVGISIFLSLDDFFSPKSLRDQHARFWDLGELSKQKEKLWL